MPAAASRAAIVLLSDDAWNQGADPVSILPFNPPLPVYTIVLGPARNAQSLKDIATKTGGTWHFVNNPINLQTNHNDRIQQTQVANVAANHEQQVAQHHFWTLFGTVLSGVPWATFAVSLSDPIATFTPNTPTGSQVDVSLTDPSCNTTNPTPYATGSGFVMFKIQTPLAGGQGANIGTSSPRIPQDGALSLELRDDLERQIWAVSSAAAPSLCRLYDFEGMMSRNASEMLKSRWKRPRPAVKGRLHYDGTLFQFGRLS